MGYESKIQASIVQYLRYSFPKMVVFHVPNGGKRNSIEAAKFKGQGVLAGVSDLIALWHDGARARACFIEVKSPKGQTTKSQEEFLGRVAAMGYDTLIAKSIDDVRLFFEKTEHLEIIS